MPDASIIIAAWNAGRTITDAIDASLRQTGVSVEVIVVDDASTDDTAEIVAAIGDPRVHLIRRPRNGGPAAARNAALAAARGSWIAILDADDSMATGRIAMLIAAAQAGGLDIVADNMWIGRPGRLAGQAYAHRLFTAETLDGGLVPITFAGYCLQNRLFGGVAGTGYLKPVLRADLLRLHALSYDSRVRIGEDFLLVADALGHGARFARHRSAGYFYATSDSSISRRLNLTDAQAMLDGDLRLRQRLAGRLCPHDDSALQAHLQSLRDGVAFLRMVGNIKQARLPALAREAWRRPAALRHFGMPIKARLSRALHGLSRHAGLAP